MKALPTFFSAGLLAALCAGTRPARAQTVGTLSFTQPSPASLRLRIATAAPLAGRVQVVRLGTGQPLFAETYDAAGYAHRFDFSQVPSGRYLVGLQSGADVYRCIVRVHTHAGTSTARITKLTSWAAPELGSAGSKPGRQAVALPVSAAAGPMQR